MSKTYNTCAHRDCGDDWGFCGLAASSGGETQDPGALACAGSIDADAWLLTRDIFGCVQWVSREPSKPLGNGDSARNLVRPPARHTPEQLDKLVDIVKNS